MPSRHQITMDVLAGADQVPGHFLFHARDSDRDDLPEVQQPSEVPTSMPDNELGDPDLLERARVGRRRVVAGAGLLGLSVAVGGCGGADKPAASASPPGAAAPTSEPPAGETRVAGIADVPVGGGAVFLVNRVVVTQPSSGQFRAFSAICSHEGCMVNQVADGTVNCPCHGSRFSISDGSVVRGPATHPLHPRSITVRDGSVVLNQ